LRKFVAAQFMRETEFERWYADVSKITPTESNRKRGKVVFLRSPPGDFTTKNRAIGLELQRGRI
jgi:hypothetical protein